MSSCGLLDLEIVPSGIKMIELRGPLDMPKK